MFHFRQSLRAYDLTEQQWRVLRCLRETDGMDAKTVADECFILRPSLSRILKTLEERALVDRNKTKADQRRTLLSLTPKGLELFHQHAPESEAIYRKMEMQIGKDKLSQLMVLLNEISEKVKN